MTLKENSEREAEWDKNICSRRKMKNVNIPTVKGVSKWWPTDQIWPVTCFYKKVLLGHSHVYSGTCCPWLPSTTTADVNGYSEPSVSAMLHSLKYLGIFNSQRNVTQVSSTIPVHWLQTCGPWHPMERATFCGLGTVRELNKWLIPWQHFLLTMTNLAGVIIMNFAHWHGRGKMQIFNHLRLWYLNFCTQSWGQ